MSGCLDRDDEACPVGDFRSDLPVAQEIGVLAGSVGAVDRDHARVDRCPISPDLACGNDDGVPGRGDDSHSTGFDVQLAFQDDVRL